MYAGGVGRKGVRRGAFIIEYFACVKYGSVSGMLRYAMCLCLCLCICLIVYSV